MVKLYKGTKEIILFIPICYLYADDKLPMHYREFMYKIGEVCIHYNRLECGSRFGILLRDAIFTFIMIEIL